VQTTRSGGEKKPWPKSKTDHRQDPKTGYGNMGQGLEKAPLAGFFQEFGNCHLFQIFPGGDIAAELMNNQGNQKQAQKSADDATNGRRYTYAFQVFEKGKPISETDREKKLRHDRIGEAEVAVVVFEDRGDFPEVPKVVDKRHRQNGPAPKLVEGNDPLRSGNR
jgi:hypothetical protein